MPVIVITSKGKTKYKSWTDAVSDVVDRITENIGEISLIYGEEAADRALDYFSMEVERIVDKYKGVK